MDLKILENVPFFQKNILKIIFADIKPDSLTQKIRRLIKNGTIIQLKRGLYTTRVYFRTNQDEINLRIRFANKIRYPSYVSGAYMLQYYNMLTDIVHPVTSVTVKSSRKYSNKIGEFIYYSISEKLYTGYIAKKDGDNTIYIASRAKALFDFFYFKYWGTKKFPDNLKERERIDYDALGKNEIKQFKNYCALSHLKYFRILPNLLFNE